MIEFADVNTAIQNDPTLLKSKDWGIIQNEEFYRQNYVGLNIHFDSLITTKIEQFETDSLTSLICDLGGNIGLWLGGSILTLFEILDLSLVILDPLKIFRKGSVSTSANNSEKYQNF